MRDVVARKSTGLILNFELEVIQVVHNVYVEIVKNLKSYRGPLLLYYTSPALRSSARASLFSPFPFLFRWISSSSARP